MKELKKEIEKKFLKIRGWKNWEEYDKVRNSLKTEINARKELIDLTIKLTLKDVLNLIDEYKIDKYTTTYDLIRELKKEIEELK